MTKLNWIYFLLIKIILFTATSGCKNQDSKTIDIPPNKLKYQTWVKDHFGSTADQIILLPQKGCSGCLKKGLSFLSENLPNKKTGSSILIICSDFNVYSLLKKHSKSNISIMFDKKHTIDNQFDIDVSNMTYVNFTTPDNEIMFGNPDFDFSLIKL